MFGKDLPVLATKTNPQAKVAWWQLSDLPGCFCLLFKKVSSATIPISHFGCELRQETMYIYLYNYIFSQKKKKTATIYSCHVEHTKNTDPMHIPKWWIQRIPLSPLLRMLEGWAYLGWSGNFEDPKTPPCFYSFIHPFTPPFGRVQLRCLSKRKSTNQLMENLMQIRVCGFGSWIPENEPDILRMLVVEPTRLKNMRKSKNSTNPWSFTT